MATAKKPLSKKPVSKKPTPTTNSAKGFLGGSPLKLVVYGVQGVGKSSFAGSFPNCGFVIDPQETGVNTLVEFNQIKKPKFVESIGDYDSLLSFSYDVANDNAHGVETLVFDSLTGFEKLCFKKHCDENYDGNWGKDGFLSFQQGPKSAAKTDWPQLFDALNAVNAAGINTILVAHAQVKNFANPEGPDYERYIPYLDKEVWQQTCRWAQAVLFYNHHVVVTKEKGSLRSKADGDAERNIYTTWTPAYDAKNWYGLDPVIDAGSSGEDSYTAFKEAYLAARKAKK